MTVRTSYIEYDINQGSYSELPLLYPNYVDGVYTPVNITGATITCKFRKTPTSAVLITMSSANSSIVITDAPNGKFKLVFSSALTSSITERVNLVLVGHVEILLPGGDTIRTHHILANYSPEVNY